MSSPHDILSERQVLGAIFLSNSLISDIAPLLTPGDFYNPTNGTIFSSMLKHWEKGDPVDVPIIAGSIGDATSITDMISMQSEVASLKGAVTHARRVANLSSVRQIGFIAEGVRRASMEASEPFELLEMASSQFSHVPVPIRTYEVPNIEEFLHGEDDYEWAIPDLLERGDRAIIVAAEGVGKSMLLRQIAVQASQGIHPFTGERITPLRTLILDLENGKKLIRRKLRPMVMKAQQVVKEDFDPKRLAVQSQAEGMNILSRVDRDNIEGICASFQPELVVVGPLYKLFDTPPGKDSTGGETVAKETTRVLDSLRTRYGFSLMIEHHAPKSIAGKRDLNPFGSAVWLRWPEFGVYVQKSYEHDDMYEMGHFRGPRDERAWPSLLAKGGEWPWNVIE